MPSGAETDTISLSPASSSLPDTVDGRGEEAGNPGLHILKDVIRPLALVGALTRLTSAANG